jgi:hypothetical protein
LIIAICLIKNIKVIFISNYLYEEVNISNYKFEDSFKSIIFKMAYLITIHAFLSFVNGFEIINFLFPSFFFILQYQSIFLKYYNANHFKVFSNLVGDHMPFQERSHLKKGKKKTPLSQTNPCSPKK